MEQDQYFYRFSGIARLYGKRALEKFKNSHILIVGLGGVGSWVFESLVRSGIGQITMIDMDEVCVSNTNRQLHAMEGEVGKFKIDSLKERGLKINPECKFNLIHDFVSSKNVTQLIDNKFSYVIDAIDAPLSKAAMIAHCKERNLPIITVGSSGGRQDPTKIEVKDLTKSINDQLLKILKKDLTKHYHFPKGKNRKFHIPCVFTSEFPLFPTKDGEVSCEADKEQNLRLDCASGYGTATHLTGSFGFVVSSFVLKELARD